jgi:aminopeptidase N
MENITATTLSESLIHDKVASLDFTSEDLLSHELSHSWFGNMVTCADWGELWLNEGFATFMANMWTRHVKGEEEYLYAMFQNQQQSLRAWLQGNRRPIVLGDYDDPDALFDVYPYQRGAAVLNMLMFVLGEDLFWKAINHYLEKYRWRNVKTDDLITAIKESTGQSLEWFFDEWVYKMGHPQFDVSAAYDGANKLKITVKQVQKPDKSKPEYDSTAFFKTPLEIGVTTAAGEKAHRVWIDKAENEFVFDVDSKPLFVNFDRGNRLIKQARSNQNQAELIYQLKHDKDVMGRVFAAIRLRSSQSDASVAALREAVNREGFWGVRVQAVGSLSEMKLPDARSALLEAVRDKDPRVRSASIHSLAKLKDPALADLFIGVINHDESLYTIADACRALGQTGAPQAYETLSKTLGRDSWQDTIRIGAIDGLLATGDPRAIEASIGHALPGNSTGVRLAAFRLIAQKAKTDGRAMRILLAAIKEESLPIKLAAISHLGALRDESVITELEKVARSSNLPLAATRAANEAISQIRDPGKGVPSKF